MQPPRPPRPQARRIRLSRRERADLEKLTSQGTCPARVQKRARILLLLDDGWAPVDIPSAAGVGEATVRRVRRRYEEGGLDGALYDKPRPGAERVLTARQEAKIIAMVCGPAPRGRNRWTVRLVAEYAVKRRIVKEVGRETIRLLLRDNELKPWREKNVVRERPR